MTQISEDVQYSPSVQGVVTRQVALVRQVRGPPAVISLQDVWPGTVEQSELIAQMTKEYKWLKISKLHFQQKVTILTHICGITKLFN